MDMFFEFVICLILVIGFIYFIICEVMDMESKTNKWLRKHNRSDV